MILDYYYGPEYPENEQEYEHEYEVDEQEWFDQLPKETIVDMAQDGWSVMSEEESKEIISNLKKTDPTNVIVLEDGTEEPNFDQLYDDDPYWLEETFVYEVIDDHIQEIKDYFAEEAYENYKECRDSKW